MKRVSLLLLLLINYTTAEAQRSKALDHLTAFANALACLEQDSDFVHLRALSGPDASGKRAATLTGRLVKKYRADFLRFVPDHLRGGIQFEKTVATVHIADVYLGVRATSEALTLAMRVADDPVYLRMAGAERDVVRAFNLNRRFSTEDVSFTYLDEAREKFRTRFQHEFDLVKYMISLKRPTSVVRTTVRVGSFPLVELDVEAPINQVVEWDVLPVTVRNQHSPDRFSYTPYPVAALNYLTCDTFLGSALP